MIIFKIENLIHNATHNEVLCHIFSKILNELSIPTARDGNWHMGTVRRYDLRLLEQQHKAI